MHEIEVHFYSTWLVEALRGVIVADYCSTFQEIFE